MSYLLSNSSITFSASLEQFEQKGLSKNFLIVTDFGLSKVWQFSLNEHDRVLIGNITRPIAVDVNGINEEIFIAEESSNSIWKVPYNKKNVEKSLVKAIQLGKEPQL